MNSFIQFRKNEDLSFEAFDSELMEKLLLIWAMIRQLFYPKQLILQLGS